MKSTITQIKEYLSKAMYHIYPNVKLLLPFTILKFPGTSRHMFRWIGKKFLTCIQVTKVPHQIRQHMFSDVFKYFVPQQ